MKKLIPVALVVVAVLAAVWLIWGRGADKDDSALTLQGNVDVRQVSLAFEGSGRIREMLVEEGDGVKAGQVLARLDTVDLTLQAEQAKAQIEANQQGLLKLQNGSRPEDIAQASDRLTAAQAEASRAEADYTRLKGISANTQGRAVSGQELDRAKSAAQSASANVDQARDALRQLRNGARAEDVAASRAQVKASQAQLALLTHRIMQGELHAPVDAVVRSRLLEPGDMASPQRPAFDLALTSPKWVRVYVEEPDLGRIRTGMAAQVTSDSAPDKPLKGTIGYISSVAEFTPKSVETKDLRTSLVYEVRVNVADGADALRLGQPVTVTIDTGKQSASH